MDEQGVEAAWLFPSQGVVLEAPMLQHDVEATIEVCRAFNRWIEDEWGFAYQDRIFGVPYLNMSDPDTLVDELQWCLDHGARVIAIRHGSAVTANGLRSPADPLFDRFWGLAQESGVTVSSHEVPTSRTPTCTRSSTGRGETPPEPVTSEPARTCG
jgi:hypothetical protein